MSKTIVLEPFNDWHVAGTNSPYLARNSDRHEIRIDFERLALRVRLQHHLDNVRTINSFSVDDLAAAVQFVDKYIDQNYLPAAEATRLLREAETREKALQQQVTQLQTSTVGQA